MQLEQKNALLHFPQHATQLHADGYLINRKYGAARTLRQFHFVGAMYFLFVQVLITPHPCLPILGLFKKLLDLYSGYCSLGQQTCKEVTLHGHSRPCEVAVLNTPSALVFMITSTR